MTDTLEAGFALPMGAMSMYKAVHVQTCVSVCT